MPVPTIHPVRACSCDQLKRLASVPLHSVRSGLRGAPTILRLLAVLTVPVMSGCGDAAPPATQAEEALGGSGAAVVANMQRSVEIAYEKFSALAEAMPEEEWDWRPMEGVRSVGDVFIHVAADNWFGPALMGIESPPEIGVDTEDETVRAYQERGLTKEQTIAEMDASFKHLIAAMEATAPRAGEEVSLRGNPLTVADLWVKLVVHMHEHLGQSVAYARERGVVPPWSR